MFIKKLFGGAAEPERSFWQGFEAQIKAFSIDSTGARKPIFDRSYIIFGEEKKTPFSYELILQSFNPKEDPYAFPITQEMKPQYEIKKDEVVFDLTLNPDLHVQIEFPVFNENYELAANFKDILGRLIFQHVEKTSIKNCPDPKAAVAKYITCKSKDEPKEPEVNPALVKIIEKLQDMDEYILAGVGVFSSIDPQKKETPPVIIYPSAIFALAKKSEFVSEIRIVDSNSQVQYHKEIDEGFYFYTDVSRRSITWVDLKAGNVVCLNFSLINGNVENVKKLIQACMLQHQKKKQMEEIAKDDWEKYYIEEPEADEADQKKVKSYSKNRVELDYSPIQKAKTPEKADKEETVKPVKEATSPGLGKINEFAQGKSKEVCFVSRDKGLEVYRFKREDNELAGIESVGAFPELAKYQPKKLTLLEKDTKLLALDKNDSKRINLIDSEKGKIVAEWQQPNAINDISLLEGKYQDVGDGSNFLAVSDKEILAFDPRTKKGVVNSHAYKSDYKFQKLLGAGGEKVAVASAGGDLRFYQKLDGNAKNLIPAFIQSDVVSMDCSKDGSLLLVCHPTYILLIQTFQGDKSAFDYTFKKDSKPAPKILKIAPQAMAKFNLSAINFTSARFDEKSKGEESYIVAVTGEFMVIWNLARVMRGQLVTTTIKKMDKKLVDCEFKFDSNDLVAAFEDQLFIQGTKPKTD